MPIDTRLIEALNAMRRANDLLTIEELIDLAENGNAVFDPFSLLVSRRVRIGSRNVFHPGVTITCSEGAILQVGDENTFHATTLIAADMGIVRIGNGNQFGEGGFTARANRPGAEIAIGDGGRYMRGASILGGTRLGSGSQILGAIVVDGCRLAAGGPFTEPDPDRRGAVLKGFGNARGLTLEIGQVIAGAGTFRAEDVKPQSFFHPKS